MRHETNFTEWVGFWFSFLHVFTQDVWNLSRDFAQVELCYWHCWLAVDCNCFSSSEESTLSCEFVVSVGVVRSCEFVVSVGVVRSCEFVSVGVVRSCDC